MKTNIPNAPSAQATEKPIARTLRILVPLIKKDLQDGNEAAERAGLPYYRAAGEKLLEAKAQMKHGEFTPWVQRNLKIKDRQARYYMRLAEASAVQNGNALPFSSLREFIRHDTKARPRVDDAQLAQAEERERAAEEKINIEIVQAGYRALVAKYHPDKPGGSNELMARLNKGRERLLSNC